MTRKITPETVTLCVITFILAVLNTPFWTRLYTAVDPENAFEWCFLGAVFFAALAALNLALTVLVPAPFLKTVAIPLIVLSAGVSYYMSEYGIIIDRNMVRNVFETNTSEAVDLVSSRLLITVGAFGIVPALILWRTPLLVRSTWDEFWVRTKIAAASMAVLALSTAPFYMNYTSVFREHLELKHTLVPMNYIVATAKYLTKTHHAPARAAAPFGEDAHRVIPQGPREAAGRTITILVVGETARAANFSLGGYGRQTNPALSQIKDLLYFDNVKSCGTDTAQSVPCMFSGLGRQKFTPGTELSREGLLDILHHAGISVLWRENQSGCKGVCKRITTEILTEPPKPPYFEKGENHDEVLLDGLEAKIASLKGDAVIVLHMMGSHGPAYFKRYPGSFERFTPACQESQFSKCSNEEIVNAYDNTILYTDHVLAQLIGVLRGLSSRGLATSMIYVSDHGESLGENNLYLHGMPYAVAPKEQTHVPMVMWLSESAQRKHNVSTDCIAARAHDPVSHDNLFHSVLGLLDVETRVYKRDLDLFASCRNTMPASVPSPGKSPM